MLRITAAVGLPFFEQGHKPLLIKAANAVGVALMQLVPELTGFFLLVPRHKNALIEINFDKLPQIDV